MTPADRLAQNLMRNNEGFGSTTVDTSQQDWMLSTTGTLASIVRLFCPFNACLCYLLWYSEHIKNNKCLVQI